jgi:hypothetical protein
MISFDTRQVPNAKELIDQAPPQKEGLPRSSGFYGKPEILQTVLKKENAIAYSKVLSQKGVQFECRSVKPFRGVEGGG